MDIALSKDSYIEELEIDKGEAIWVAGLSDGTTVYQDDNRPGVEPKSAWVRLKSHIQNNDCTIQSLYLSFRGQKQSVDLPNNAEGYFFCKSIIGIYGEDKSINCALIGYLDKQNGKIIIQKWSVPELILLSTEERDEKLAEEALIRNKI